MVNSYYSSEFLKMKNPKNARALCCARVLRKIDESLMDEYSYEDFDDIVPSQALVPSQVSHKHNVDDSDDQQPAKRAKTSHEDEAPLDQPDTQLTQFPSDVRKIPGPAGSLPPIHATSAQSFPSKAVVLSSQIAPQDGLFIQSKFHKKAGNGSVGVHDEYASDFTRGPWLVMLQNSELPPFGMSLHALYTSQIYFNSFTHQQKGAAPTLLQYNIGYILDNRRVKKIPRLVALVKAVVPTDADFKVTLRDPTGEIDGALQRKASELHPSIVSGAVVVLEQVCTLASNEGKEGNRNNTIEENREN